MQIRGTQKQQEKRRLYAVREIVSGNHTVASIAKKVKVTERAVELWMAKHRAGGEAALRSKPLPGRPRLLSDHEHELLRRFLTVGPRVHGFDTDLWSCPMIAKLIEKSFGVHYHVDHIHRVLERIGFSPQKPTARAIERDERAIKRWINHDWELVKKSA